ncbi:MAG: hypothetical protein HUM72_09455, partial [Dolichospermum sp.]|nr:hypothetical protein [Dolichospermum sp.]
YGALRYRIPSTPKQRFLRSASLSHPSTHPNSDSYGALRYRTPSNPQTAIPTERFAIALPHSPKATHPSNFQKAIAPPQLPKSDRTPPTSKKRSHPLNFPKAIASPQLPQTAIAPFNLPNSDTFGV